MIETQTEFGFISVLFFIDIRYISTYSIMAVYIVL